MSSPLEDLQYAIHSIDGSKTAKKPMEFHSWDQWWRDTAKDLLSQLDVLVYDQIMKEYGTYPLFIDIPSNRAAMGKRFRELHPFMSCPDHLQS